jgi:PAS domain S-box-containing protein
LDLGYNSYIILKSHSFGHVNPETGMEDMRRAEEELRESEERFRVMTSSAQDAIVMMDDEGRVTFWNEAAERIFGYSKQEALGTVVHDLLAKPGYREQYRRAFSEWQATGQGPVVNKTIELTALRKDGVEIPVELSLSSFRIRGRWNALAVTRDITERKRSDAELRKSNQRLDLLADTAAQLLLSESPQEVIDSLCRKVLSFLDCQAFFNYLVDDDRKRLHLNACGGIPVEDVRKMEWLDYGVGLCGCSARDGSRLVVEDLQDTDDQYTALVRPFGIQAYACHPLMAQGQVLGTLSFCSRTRRRFNDDELSLMKAVADQVAIALDRKRSAERIASSEQKFRAIFENSRDAIFLIAEDHSFAECNPAAMEMFRCGKSELLEKRPYSFSPYLQPDGRVSREKAEELLDAALRGTPQGFEWIHHRADGSRFDAYVVLNSFELGGKIMMQSIVRDISARKKAEAALRESELRFRALVETTSDWIWEINEDDVYTYAGPKIMEYLGYEPDEVIGLSHYDLMPPNEVRHFKTRFHAISRKRRPFYALEKKNLHKNGTIIILETSGVPVFDKHGAFRGYRGIDRDVTERKMLEQKFLHAQKMDAVGQLASGIAHEFNNIIMAIIGYGNLLLPRMEGDAEGRKFTTQLLVLATRAATLTHDLLTFGRKQGVNPTPVDLNGTIRKTESLLRWLIGESIELKVELQEGVLPVLLVSGQIEQLLINLATNARDAMPDGGLLTVQTATVAGGEDCLKAGLPGDAGNYALVSVSDTGTGMDEKTRGKIFDPFFTTKEAGKGTGLGLTTVYGIVRQHKGHIRVDSKPGHGTTFSVYLPLIETGLM